MSKVFFNSKGGIDWILERNVIKVVLKSRDGIACVVTICEQFWPLVGNFLHWRPSKDERRKFWSFQQMFICKQVVRMQVRVFKLRL